jgi:hypothetical protein
MDFATTPLPRAPTAQAGQKGFFFFFFFFFYYIST